MKKQDCTNCTCLNGDSVNETTYNVLVGDGFCNDETNIEDCMFDGLDCCGPNIRTDLCLDCLCHG